MSYNKPLREGASQFRGQINLVRSKAIASNRSYRIRPFSASKFTVEYANNCRVIDDDDWTRATQFDIDLPKNVRVTDVPITTVNLPGSGNATFDSTKKWKICFDSRGVASGTSSVILKDFKGDSRAKIVLFNIIPVGGIDVITYDNDNDPNKPNYNPNPIPQAIKYDSYNKPIPNTTGQIY